MRLIMDPCILIVDDEARMRKLVKDFLVKNNMDVVEAADGEEAITIFFQEKNFDLVILDVMMPKMDGWEVLKTIREYSQVPVIMLTARDEVMDKVAGLDGGADDYMTKPFAIEELLARIRLVLKKRGTSGTKEEQALTYGELEMNLARHEVRYGGELVALTPREFDLLKVLLENKNIVVSRDTLLEKVCGYDYLGETNVIDVYVRYLRSKLDDVYHVKIIQTVRGVGYCIKD